MTNSVIPLLVRAAHLTQGIPALVPPTGVTCFDAPTFDSHTNFDLSIDDDQSGCLRPNGWPARTQYQGRWLHSDMKDVAFYFNFKFYDRIIVKGGLQ